MVRYFTVAEANALIPTLEGVLDGLRECIGEVAETAERLQILDVLWGSRVLAEDNPDYAECRDLRARVAMLMSRIEAIVERELNGRGLRFPQGGLEHGLIDFPTTWEGRVVYLCWKRGEAEIEAWHEIDAGFAGRQYLSSEHVRGMGSAQPSDPW